MTTTKKHSDGGTYKVLQLANTRDGWAIALTEWTTYRGNVVFEILRVSPDNASVRIDQATTEDAARKLANKHWTSDRRP